MTVYMTPQDYQISPFMYAGSTLGNALYSGLDLKQVFSCALLASSFEEFDEAVSATINLRDLCMSIEPTCDFCGASVKPRCRNDQEAAGCTMNKKDNTMGHQESERRINSATGQGGFTPAPHQKPGKVDTQISLTMAVDKGEFDPITISSHCGADVGLIGIEQLGNKIIIARGDVETMIASLTTIAKHLP